MITTYVTNVWRIIAALWYLIDTKYDKKNFILDEANDSSSCVEDEPSKRNKYIGVKGVMVAFLLLMSNLWQGMNA